MKKHTYTNSFHDTEYTTKYSPKDLDKIKYTHPYKRTSSEKALITRMNNKLCGANDCKCGDLFGIR